MYMDGGKQVEMWPSFLTGLTGCKLRGGTFPYLVTAEETRQANNYNR